jgi:hypothetical protein
MSQVEFRLLIDEEDAFAPLHRLICCIKGIPLGRGRESPSGSALASSEYDICGAAC